MKKIKPFIRSQPKNLIGCLIRFENLTWTEETFTVGIHSGLLFTLPCSMFTLVCARSWIITLCLVIKMGFIWLTSFSGEVNLYSQPECSVWRQVYINACTSRLRFTICCAVSILYFSRKLLC